DVEILNIILIALLVLTSIFLTLLILMHKGKGGGMSDMFGGGMSSSLGSSGVAERNLNRFTTLMASVWAARIILLGILARLNGCDRGDTASHMRRTPTAPVRVRASRRGASA